MDEEVYPVCSPSFLRDASRLQTPEDLSRETLIHDQSMDDRSDFPTWTAWVQKAETGCVATARALKINCLPKAQ